VRVRTDALAHARFKEAQRIRVRIGEQELLVLE
jgi:hypothetical protein